MALLVQKYGGTSIGTIERILAVADRIARLRREGHDLVVVVSAMGDTTDELLGLAARISDAPHRREMDMLLTAGERISMALLSMALNSAGCPAISFTGSQSGIITDSGHGRARIRDVKPFRIRDEIAKGRVVIVAGFQGVSPEKEVTTLGRGGSDTSAVAVAVAFQAAECAIYTDVDGVLTADPRLVPAAFHIPRLTFDAMLEFSSRGAGVVYSRAVEVARNHRMPLRVLNSLRDGPGTVIDGEVSMEGKGVVGVAAEDRVIGVHVSGLRAAAGAGEFLSRLAELGLEPVALHQFSENGGTMGMAFTAPDRPETAALLDRLETIAATGGGSLRRDPSLGAVSVVAGEVINSADLPVQALDILSRAGIRPASFTAGTLSLTFLVNRVDIPAAVRALHAALIEKKQD